MELKILHTTDIHSNFENLSRVVTKIKEIKDENTIILDAGDFSDFKKLELLGTKGLLAVELLEYAGYDAIAVGNNEIFNGVDTLSNMATKSKVAFLSCNLYKKGLNKIKGIFKSTIIKRNGLNFLIIGTSPDLGDFYPLFDLELKNYIKAIKEEINLYKNKFDKCILLSHLGLNSDKDIAENIEDIDLIIGGHFHILMDEAEVVNKKVIHTSGANAENLGLVKLKIDGEFKVIEAKNINVMDIKKDNGALDIIKKNKTIALNNLNKPLYQIDKNLWHDVIEENPITNLLADSLNDILDCDIGIINSGVLNGGVKKGDVSEKKLLEICPSPLNPTCFEIKGKYIKNALENSLDGDFCLSDGQGPGFRGKFLGRLHVSNAKIEHDGRNILNIYINGEKLKSDKYYKVASSDYLFRATGYNSFKHSKNEVYNKELLRDVLRKYLLKNEFIESSYKERWELK
ncbi:MAG: bifunctional metallophosphatase/5'-nucleotidase [Firmicutes bacterium]|nr:bifunctional metallophosphatase/5'-nucleotidase [Bacillota bacterium]